jgi:Zn-dependent peptidase ImmA (M78 family)
MGDETFKPNINVNVLIWAIQSSGWEKKELVEKLRISGDVYDKWITGIEKPTLKQLEAISYRTKRPLASFFLSEVPKEKPLPKDYRLNPSKRDKFLRKTMLAIRKARTLQFIAKELSSYLYEESNLKIQNRKISESPKKLGQELREFFELNEQKQRRFNNPYELFRFIREKLESYNIYSFQISMPMEDARGFALSDDLPKTIVVNSADLIEARIFTLMHEFGHILLNDTSLDLPDFGDNNPEEKWCNEFASSFLLPDELAKKVFEENKNKLTETQILNSLSRKYKVSKSMLLYNMLKLKFISLELYLEITTKFKRIEKIESSGGGVSTEKKRLSELGDKFITLVAENTNKNFITYSDALSYLSIKSKNFNKLMKNI